MLSQESLSDFKRKTEEKWRARSTNPSVSGFQFQAGTRWNPGLSEEQIGSYERDMEARFPDDFKAFLRVMNGTDRPALNVYSSCGESPREGLGVYRYPDDLDHVLLMIAELPAVRTILRATLYEEGFDLSDLAKLVPIYAHRYVVCGQEPDKCAVLSIWDAKDAIVYGHTLEEYLEREFLSGG